MKKKLIVSKFDDDTRIDRWLKRRFSSLNQAFIQNKLRRGLIRVNEKKVKANYKLIANEIISIREYSEKKYPDLVKLVNNKIIPEEVKLKFKNSLIYECNEFLIINKWSGISTQGISKIEISINDLIKSISDNYNLVHRLDKETSGLLIIAKNYQATKLFGKLFREKLIEKIYIAACQGIPKNLKSVVKLDINKKNNHNYSTQTITKYVVIAKSKKISLNAFKPLTGKTHQLRIVSKYINCPIIGDSIYNKSNNYKKEKLKLNAHYLKFNFNDQEYEFKSTLPTHFINFMKKNDLSLFLHEKTKKYIKVFLILS